jgi:putative exosortase-associated protein (TIGR04073 family)
MEGKMRKNIFFVLILASVAALVFNTNLQADCEEEDYIEMGSIKRIRVVDADKIPYEKRPINKLNRGVINGVTFWTELPAGVAKVSSEQNLAMGVTVGVVQGAITSVARAGTALFDTVTFFIPPYDKPVMKPEYALNHADDKMRELFW